MAKKQISQIKDVFDKGRKSKDAKTLVSNFGYLTLLQVAGYLFPLITMPYLARTIGAVGFGKIAFASATVMWFNSITTWGFDYTATRDVARNREDLGKVSEIFSNIIWARTFLAVVSLVILCILIAFIPKFNENAAVLLVTILIVPGHVLFPEWLFQAMERMKYITILSLLSKFFFTIAVFVFIHKPSDYILQPLFISFGYLLSGIIAFYFIIVRWKIRLLKPSFSRIIQTIKNGSDVFINNFMPNLYNSFSVVLLGAFHGDVANGILSAGEKCISICHQFMNVLSRTFFPFLSRHSDKHHIYAKLSISIAAVFSLVIFLFSPLLIHIFFTEEFDAAIGLSRLMAFSLLFMTISNVYGTNFLILRGYERQLRNITFVLSIVGFLMAIPLIHFYSYWGAAITITLTRGLIAITAMLYAKRIERNTLKE